MKQTQALQDKIYTLPDLLQEVKRWRLKSRTIAFTNGVFDLLHEGHIASLAASAATADILIVGVNADASVKRLKGPSRPVQSQNTRALLLASLLVTDAVIIFEEDTPAELIKNLLPDVLVKGGDYKIEDIAGAKEVIDAGGKVILADMIEGVSTTTQIERMKND